MCSSLKKQKFWSCTFIIIIHLPNENYVILLTNFWVYPFVYGGMLIVAKRLSGCLCEGGWRCPPRLALSSVVWRKPAHLLLQAQSCNRACFKPQPIYKLWFVRSLRLQLAAKLSKRAQYIQATLVVESKLVWHPFVWYLDADRNEQIIFKQYHRSGSAVVLNISAAVRQSYKIISAVVIFSKQHTLECDGFYTTILSFISL